MTQKNRTSFMNDPLPAIPLAGVVAPLAFGDILRAAPAIPPAER